MCTHTSSATSLQKWRSCPCLGAGGHSRGGLAGEPASVALDIYVDCHFSVFVDKWPIIPWHQLFSISSSVPELRQNYRVSCKILNTEQQTGWRHLHYKYSCTVGISVPWASLYCGCSSLCPSSGCESCRVFSHGPMDMEDSLMVTWAYIRGQGSECGIFLTMHGIFLFKIWKCCL